tara:strand:- start:469 stop:609 length:141 start_codon:yes stop_codon:yes gene_type:complete
MKFSEICLVDVSQQKEMPQKTFFEFGILFGLFWAKKQSINSQIDQK